MHYFLLLLSQPRRRLQLSVQRLGSLEGILAFAVSVFVCLCGWVEALYSPSHIRGQQTGASRALFLPAEIREDESLGFRKQTKRIESVFFCLDEERASVFCVGRPAAAVAVVVHVS